MSLKNVLNLLFGKVTDGYLSASWFCAGVPATKYFKPDQLDEMAAFIRMQGTKVDTSIGINPRYRELDQFKRGTRKDIRSVVCAWQDFDIKGPAHREIRLPETEEALLAFIDSLPVQPTFLVATGHGLHAYWVFEEPFLIKNEDDRCYIERILKSWEQYIHAEAMEKYGWVFDPVADLPRMLRAPETTNFKTDDHPVAKVTRMTENRCSPELLAGFGKEVARVPATELDAEDEFALMGTGSTEELRRRCPFIDYGFEEAETLSEPYWFGLISNVAQTADGHQKVHEMSEPYPKYTYAETEKKYLAAIEANKPVTCEYIRKTLCFDCGKHCGVRSPIGLLHKKKPEPSPLFPEKPIPLDGMKVPPFPVDALPEDIGDYVVAVAESTQTPVDLAASTSLAAISTGIGRKYVIRPKPDWIEQLNLFIEEVLPPSERKSAVINLMGKPMNKHEQEWNAAHAAEIEFSKTERNILERRLRSLEEQASKGKAEIADVRKASEELTNFREVKPLRYYSDDVTTEKLASIMAENNGIAAIFSAEAGIFDMLKGMYTRNVNLDVFLKGYSGDPIRVDRIGRESETIYHPTLTVMLMAQPSVLAGVMGNGNFRGRGLTARFLYTVPESNIGNRTYRSQPIPEETYLRYERCIRNILTDEPENAPEVITLSREADAMIEAFSNELEPKLKTELADIADWAGKLVGNTVRIAGLLCRAEKPVCRDFLDVPEPLVVSGQTMANAIRIGRYFLEHAKAAFSLLGADESIQNCKYVLGAIEKAGLRECTRRDIMRLCRSFKTKEQIQPVLDMLVEYGYLAEKTAESPNGKGRTPAAAYIVNPCIFDQPR